MFEFIKKGLFFLTVFFVYTTNAYSDGILIDWGVENTINLVSFTATGAQREEGPTIADGDCTLSKDGVESSPTLTWTDTGNHSKMTLSASDSEFKSGVLSCEDTDTPDSYLAFKHQINVRGAPDGTAQAGGASTITLATTASSTDNAYNKNIVVIIDGPGIPLSNCISDYVGSTRVATVVTAWDTQPTSATKYAIIAGFCS